MNAREEILELTEGNESYALLCLVKYLSIDHVEDFLDSWKRIEMAN